MDRLRSLGLLAWSRVARPLRDFGFGRKSIWEGGVGLFLIGGVGALARASRNTRSPVHAQCCSAW